MLPKKRSMAHHSYPERSRCSACKSLSFFFFREHQLRQYVEEKENHTSPLRPFLPFFAFYIIPTSHGADITGTAIKYRKRVYVPKRATCSCWCRFFERHRSWRDHQGRLREKQMGQTLHPSDRKPPHRRMIRLECPQTGDRCWQT